MGLAIFPLAGVRVWRHTASIGAPSRYSLAVLPLAGVRGAIGICRGALAGPLALAVCLAGVRHAAGLFRFGVVSKR